MRVLRHKDSGLSREYVPVWGHTAWGLAVVSQPLHVCGDRFAFVEFEDVDAATAFLDAHDGRLIVDGQRVSLDYKQPAPEKERRTDFLCTAVRPCSLCMRHPFESESALYQHLR